MSLVNQFLLERSQLFLPKHTEDHSLDVVSINQNIDLLEISSLEMIPSHPVVSGSIITHVLVPGIAFDSYGTRLGFGSGCYDRFLSTFIKNKRWGICFQEQISDHLLPKAPHDIPVDIILSF